MGARGRLIESETDLRALLARVRRVAVLGIKTESQRGQPAIEVPRYLERAGLDVVPVPVYYPEVETILGRPVYRSLAEIPGDIDLVDVFRRSKDLMPHLADVLAKRPPAVWLQSGIRHAAFAEALLEAGIDVVQDRCLMVDHRHFATA
ncbi:CoA-binding protein [Arenimonas sp. MALMAid1274]|uniref:CoA-binding protein n=1 Tax=Arenimonas sp. MALMAid1274 TaxID=3411630 RepID=UPI003BA22F85